MSFILCDLIMMSTAANDDTITTTTTKLIHGTDDVIKAEVANPLSQS